MSPVEVLMNPLPKQRVQFSVYFDFDFSRLHVSLYLWQYYNSHKRLKPLRVRPIRIWSKFIRSSVFCFHTKHFVHGIIRYGFQFHINNFRTLTFWYRWISSPGIWISRSYVVQNSKYNWNINILIKTKY